MKTHATYLSNNYRIGVQCGSYYTFAFNAVLMPYCTSCIIRMKCIIFWFDSSIMLLYQVDCIYDRLADKIYFGNVLFLPSKK